MRPVPAVCRRVPLLFLLRLAVAGTLLKNTRIIAPDDLNLQVLSCLIISARAELCASLMPSDRTPSIPLVLPEEPLSIYGSTPVDALVQPGSYACVSTNKLLNN